MTIVSTNPSQWFIFIKFWKHSYKNYRTWKILNKNIRKMFIFISSSLMILLMNATKNASIINFISTREICKKNFLASFHSAFHSSFELFWFKKKHHKFYAQKFMENCKGKMCVHWSMNVKKGGGKNRKSSTSNISHQVIFYYSQNLHKISHCFIAI